MFYKLKFIGINLINNLIILLLLFITTQNTNKYQVRIRNLESVKIPIGIIIGLSYVSGGFLGNSFLIFINSKEKE